MTLNCLKKWWPKTWAAVLQDMYTQGFALCLKCGGLPHETFIDPHNTACPGKL